MAVNLQEEYNKTNIQGIIDQLEEAGVLGPLEGSKGRKVLIQTEEELNNMI